MKKRGLFAILFGMAVLSFGLFNSCDIDIGLGSAVDVEPPTLFIENPPASKIIRDAFPISGTYKDDGTISAITVELTNTETQVKYPKIDGTWGKENTWSATVDPIKLKIPDGKYEATITISDNGGHHSTSTRSFIIDNTAPVVVLSRPASDAAETDLNKIESYGQYLTLEGQAADDNDIEKIVIKFYSKDNPDKDPIVKEITSIPPTISLDVAKFLDENDPTYTALYGTDKNAGEKYYYCTISAFDGAKRYPAKGDEKADDDYGNEESSYILWTDWEKFQSEYSKTTGSSSKIKLPELYSIKAGKSETTQERSVSEKTLISAFFNKAITRGSFKLNPLNNPSYSISGLDIGLANDVENERPLTVQLSKGLDGLSLDTDNMKVYLIPVTTEADGSQTRGKKIYPQQSTYEKKGDGQFITVIQKDNVKDSDGKDTSLVYGTTYVIGVDGEDIEGNKIVPSFDGKEFFIRFKAKNVAPGLTIDEPVASTSYLKKGDKLLIKGTTSVPDGYPTVSITCKKGAETTATTIYTHKVKESDKLKVEGGLIYYNWQFTVPTSGTEGQFFFDQTNTDQYDFDITSNLEELPTTRPITVIYDVVCPTISINSMLPTAEKYTDDEDGTKVPGSYLNGDVTMKVSILDDYKVNTEIKDPNDDKRPYFIIQDSVTGDDISFRVGTETTPTVKHYITKTAMDSFVIHTEDIANTVQARKIKVKIFAQDSAGNLGVDAEDNTKAYFEREYTVDQATDIPVILPYNSSSVTLKYSSMTELDEHLAAKDYKSVLTTGSDLLLSLKDDDGIKKVTFYIGSKDTALAENANPDINQTLQNVPSDYSFQRTLPTVSGRYECKIQVEDTVGKTSEKKFWIIVTGAAPQVTISNTSPDNKIITLSTGAKTSDAKDQFVNTIAIESGYSEFTVTRSEKINGVETPPVVLYGENGTKGTILRGNSFEDIFVPAAGHSENKIKYTVTDEMGHSGEREFVYYTDSAAPAIAADSIKVPSNSQTESVSFRFEATANDPSEGELNAGYKQSGISKLQYVFENGTASTVPSATVTDKIKTVNGVSSLNETIIFNDEEFNYVFNTEGTKTIYIRAIDDVGNVGAWVAKSFMFDKSKPVLSIDSYKRDIVDDDYVTLPSGSEKIFQTGKKFGIKGSASDATGLNSFEIWQNDLKLDISKNDIVNGTWSITDLPKNAAGETVVESGTYTYTVKATDNSAFGTGENAQNAKTSTQTVVVNIDVTYPRVEIGLANGDILDSSTVTLDSTIYGVGSLSGSAPYTFNGKAADDELSSATGVKELFYTFTTTDSSAPDESSYTSYGNPSGGNWNIPMNLGTGKNGGQEIKIENGVPTTLYEGQKYLWVYLYDNAGNKSGVKHVGFMVDQAVPEIIETKVNMIKSNGEKSQKTPDADNIVYLNDATEATGYELEGTVKDVNDISKVTVDGVSALLSKKDDGSYTWKWTNTNQQGDYIHEIVVYDKSGKNKAAGKSSSTKVHVIFDTTKPTTTNVNLDSDSALATNNTWFKGTGDNYITGTAGDVGSGIAKIEVKPDNKTDWTTLPLQENWTYKFTIDDTLSENDYEDNSYHTVQVRVTDKAKNVTTTPYYFRYDKTLPLANLELNKNDQYVNASDFADITFTGYAHDGISNYREVGSAEITVKKDNVLQSDLKMTLVPVSDHDENFGNFTKSGLNAAEFADGKYTFTLDVKDKAGNSPSATSTLTQTMIVDQTKPVITAKGLVVGNAAAVNSIRTNNPKATIQVTFTEDNIDSVYYYVDDLSVANRVTTAANGTIKEAASIADEWIGMSRKSNTGTSYTYEKAHQFSDGKGKVYIKIVDKAGNVTYDISSLSYEVDTKVPDVCTLGNVTVEGTILTGTRLINGTKDVTFTVTATDYDDNYNTAVNPRTKVGNSASKVISVAVKTGGGVKAVTDDFTYTHTTDGVWTIKIPANQLQSGAVSVTVTDSFGNSKDYLSLFTLDLDNKAPSLGSYSLANSYDATATNATSKTFYMNNQNNGFRLEGIAKDDRVNGDDNNGEIEKVELTLTAGSKTETLLSYSSAWTFEIQKATWKDWSGDVIGKIVITDKAKNVTTVDNAFTIKFDNDAPKAVHWADSSNKDIYFRFGNADNDKDENDANKWETGDAVIATNNPNNTDVGKKYSSNSWGNDSTIEIRGTFFETGSGIKTINYAIFNVAPTTSITLSGQNYTLLEALEKGKLKAKTDSEYINAIGTFAPLDIPEERKVPYTAATGRTSEVVKSNFRTSLAGFNGTNNYLVLVAEDYVGNRAVDSLKNTTVTKENGNITAVTEGNTNWNDSMSYYIIKKDTTAPTITASVTEGAYTNGDGNIKIVCEASDAESEINNVTVKVIDNDNKTVKINGKDETKAELKSGKYEVSIPASAFTSDTYTVYAKATDNAGAGNSKEVSAGTITVDKDPPTFDTDSIKLTEITGTGDSAQTKTAYKSDTGTYYVNNTTTGKTFKISGRAEDNLGVKEVSISVVEKLPADSTETAKTLTIAPQDTNGSFTFNVSAWSTWTTGATVTLNVTDKAGNTVAYPYTMDIVFDTAAPKVVPANIVTPNTTQTESSLFTFRDNGGSISDGTSGPKTIDIAFTTTNTKPSAAQVTGIEVSSTGVWSSTVEFDDSKFGEVFKKTENGKVVDVQGTKYLWIRAYDNAGNVTSRDTEWVSTSFKYDKAVPSISFDDQTTPAMNSYNKDAFTIKVNASDTWGVKDIKIYKVTGEGNSKVDTELTNATVSNGSFTFAKGALSDGTYNFKVVVTDNADKKNSVERSFTVDTTPPTISGQKVSTSTQPAIPSTNWYKTNQLGIEATITDEHSEISSVQAYVDNVTNEKTSLIKGSNNKWTGSISCGVDGAHIIYIIAQDVALNETEPTATIPVQIDTTAPNSPVFLGAGPSGSIISANDISSLLVNPTLNKPVIVYAALKEGGSGLIKSGIADTGAFIQRGKSATNSAELSNTVAIKAFTHIWTANNEYSEGNIVKNTDKLYVCDIAHTAGSTFDTEKWTELDESEYKFWSYTIPADTSNMTNGGINFTVADKAGNKADYVLFQMTVDSTPPTVEIKSITKAGSQTNIGTVDDPVLVDDVNGKITISGSASDTNKLDTVVLKYQKAGATTWTDLVQKSDSTANNWTAELNTSGLENNTKYTLKAIATDAAGNTKEVTKDIYVNQDTDRPVINLTNIDLTVATFGNNEIYGNVSDDDGLPASISYYIGNTEPDENTKWIRPAENPNFTYTNGSFKLKLDDGFQQIWFKVNDGTNDFVSSSETSYTNATSEKILKSIKVVDSQSHQFGYLPESGEDITASVINTTIDTTQPFITKLEWAYPVTTGTPEWKSINSKATAGGTGSKTNINIHVYAYDINGVDTVKLMVPKNSSDKSTVSGYSNAEEDLDEKYYIYNFTKDETSTYDDEDSNITYIKWTSPAIIATGMESGIRECKLEVFDGEKTTQETVSLTIDNTPADFEITNYADNQTVYGIKDIEVQGMVTANDMAHVYYCLTKGDITTAPAAGNSWKTIKFENSRLNSVIKFDGDTNATDVTHEIRLRDWLKTLYEIDDIDNHNDTEKLKLWTYVVDTMENSSEPKALTLNVIPNGDKPVVKIIYPGEGLKLGGTIRFSGETTIETSSVEKVYAQIIVPGATSANWVTELDKLISDAKNKSTGNEPYYKVVEIDENTKGIEVTGTPTSWNFAINSHHELEKDNDTPNYTVNFIAKSASHKLSDLVARTIQIDKNAPSLGDLQLVKLKSESASNKFADSNIDKRIPYTEDMWISGQWYLLGSVTDGNGVQELLWHDGSTSHTLVEGDNETNTGEIKDSTKVKTLGNAHSTEYPDPDDPDNETKKITITAYDYEFFIPIGAISGYGAINYSLSAVDATNERNSVSRTIKVNYDCTAPAFKATVSSADDAAELSATGNKVQNSSGMYSVYGTFDEEGKQSGFARIAMYFTRTIGDTTNVIDPMVTKDKDTGTNDKKNNYYLSTGFSYTSVASKGDGIYWKALSGGSTADNKITISNIPAWVRKGGICKVDGVIYKIKTVTTSDLTVDGTLTTGSGKTVYVTPALVIDNLSSESKKQGQTYNGLYNKDVEDTNVISGGDGDWLIEGVSQQSSSYPWTASLNSQNMLDGPVTIHFVAFDKAGNATEKSYSGNVANNAPRLAGVTVWTDYNGNGKGWRNTGDHAADYEDETKSRYYSRVRPTINGKATDRSKDVTSKLIVSGNQNDAEGIAAASSTAFMKVTDTVKFIPEIVGGNGALNYEYKIGKKAAFHVDATTKEVTDFTESTTAGSKTLKSSAKAAITKDDGNAVSGTDVGQDVPTETDSNSVTYVNGNTDSVIRFDGATILGALDNSTSDDPTWFDVVISDSTEGDTKLSCEMQIALQINYTDETSPVVKIRPFYWNSKTNNSVIWATNGNPEGHIELEGDLPTSFTTDGTGVNDRDPKVSGKIKLEGYAYDDIKLKELYVKFDNHTKLNADDFKVADYTPSQQTKWTAVTHNTNDGWDFSAEDVYCNGNGHLVHWTLTIDTAARTTVAATDQAVVVYAKDDRGGHDSVHGSTTAQTSLTTNRWGDVKTDENAWTNYYEDFYYNTKVSDSTPDTALVYKGPDSYIWKNVKAQENAKTIYYTDFYCGTNATDTTSDNTVVYKDTLSYRYKMDIVPYVTEIVTHLSPYSVSTPSVYARTALGNYPVYEGETIQFKGFNIGTNIAKVTIPGMNETTLKNGTVNNEANKSNTITLTKGTGSGARSGDITLTVNSIPALNNTNKDDAKGNYSGDIADSNYANGYNRQPNGVNNNLLNDNISLDVWQFLNAAEPRNGKSDNPTMKISSQGRIGISYSNAVVYFSAPFIDNGDQQSRDKIKSQTAIAQNYGWFTNNTFCFDPYGYPYAAAQSPDTNNSTGAAYLQFFSRKAGKNIVAMDLNENYQKIANSSRIEAICIPINKDENDWTTDIDRTQSISMTATMPNPTKAPADNNKVTIHMAYWDNLTKQIRYRQGQVGENPESFGFVGNNDWDGNMRNYGGSLLDLQGRRSAQQEAGGRYESVYDSISSKFTDGNTNNRSAAIKAQKIYRVAGKSIGTEYAAAYQVTTDKHGGKYVDIGVLPSTAKGTPTVVLCWYDADAKRLVVSYDTPKDTDAKDSTGMCNGDWQTNAQYIGTKGGMYCRMAIDGDDGIHIAHYDYLGADLLYTYIPSENSVPQISSATTYVIDSYLSVGTWCTIDVAKELKPGSTTEYNYVPQIGYFAPASEDSTAAARIAKASKFDANGRPLFAGVENDKFTGAWEISVIPTQSIPIIDRVNVGMYKDANGVLGVIPTGGDNRISVSPVSKPGYPVSDSTTVYGNGTTNPAVVYCLDDGPVELAQKK